VRVRPAPLHGHPSRLGGGGGGTHLGRAALFLICALFVTVAPRGGGGVAWIIVGMDKMVIFYILVTIVY
jgi:hypothetical protein